MSLSEETVENSVRAVACLSDHGATRAERREGVLGADRIVHARGTEREEGSEPMRRGEKHEKRGVKRRRLKQAARNLRTGRLWQPAEE
jgi:hypothetical protein